VLTVPFQQAAQEKQLAEEKIKAERTAKLEAWKAKQAAKRAAKEQEAAKSAANTRTILEDMDKKAAGLPTSTQAAAADPPAENAADTPYAGKFDPKAIAKRMHSSSTGPKTLGDDVPIPDHKPSTTVAPISKAGALKGKGTLTGFGLGHKHSADPEKVGKRTLDFGEEESSRKKLEKLPTPPLEENGAQDATLANGADGDGDDDDDDVELADGTEEEAAAAARAAAAKRDERLQQENANQTNGDVTMTDANGTTEASAKEDVPMQDEEEVDPLDAFMSGLGDPDQDLKKRKTFKTKGKFQEPQAMFSDDEGELDAVGDKMDDVMSGIGKKKKKEIPTVDHSKFEYEPFRKSFYTEPAELADMTEQELADLRLELDGIKVRGVNVPKPVTKWEHCGLGVQTLDVIRKLGYDHPTSIQSQAIPAIMSGRDVIGVAKTGSGKTIAFLLPLFRHVKDRKFSPSPPFIGIRCSFSPERPLAKLDGPIGLILTPTRELCTQIFRECRPFLKALNLRAVCAYGGASISEQVADLKRGAEIVVCTPGRFIDLLAANAGRVTNLRRVTYCCLDEADRMFDMGFEPQVMKILANIRPQRQTVLFSATFPRNMEALARKTLNKPVEIVIGGRSVVAPEITQIVEVREENTKFHRLLQLLGDLYDVDEDARTLIFVDRQESADWLLNELMKKAYPCYSIHGGKDQIDRDSAINDFKNGVVPILIATSVAARGLDVKQLKLVVNYDAPNHLEDYVHRAGRTGRAGNKGTAVTFLSPENPKYSLDIVKALKQSGQEVPEKVQAMADDFLEKVKAGKEKASGSGFGGKGLERLDQERDAARNRERKAYKTGDEPDEEEKEKEEDKRDNEIVVKARGSASTPTTETPPSAPNATTATGGTHKGLADLNGKIVVHKTERETPSTNKSTNPLDRVKAAVANIDSRLTQRGQLRPGQPIDNKGPDAGAFHATLEINDFPQKARWAVTNRTNVAKILEATSVSITTKGTFYMAGKEPGPGDLPKLYILVEGDTELMVTQAMEDLYRLLKEGVVAAETSAARAPASGRYNVV
jgi:ATP-dependent RNA helicase DDX46/PRP5